MWRVGVVGKAGCWPRLMKEDATLFYNTRGDRLGPNNQLTYISSGARFRLRSELASSPRA